MVSESSLLFQSGIATTFCNLKSDSRDAHSATKRTEGWTEIWGDPQKLVDEREDCWQVEAEHSSLPVESDVPSLTILQYRPAWLEQLVLRIANIPHTVVNTSYSSQESTGPLPVLRDPTTVVLVGRRQPRLRSPQIQLTDDEFNPTAPKDAVATAHLEAGLENDILGYLKTARGVDLNAAAFQPYDPARVNALHSKATLLSLLITTKLQKSLWVLRYEDRDAWEQIYRPQCWDCSSNYLPSTSSTTTAATTRRLPTLRGVYQAWSERVVVRKMLRSFERGIPSVDQAKREARSAYALLERQLEERDNDNLYLLGTTKPALVDALLWDHLAEALSDINLVVILADFPLLVRYFQRIHETYFATTTATTSSSSSSEAEVDWKLWNHCQNQMNAFQQIPLEADLKKPKKGSSSFRHALELMQSLSVRDHDLVEILKVGKAAREKTPQRPPKKTTTTTPNRNNNNNKEESEKPSAAEIMLRQQERSDQYWVSVILGAAVVVGLSIVGAYEQ